MFITPSFKKSLIVEQFQGNYLNLSNLLILKLYALDWCHVTFATINFDLNFFLDSDMSSSCQGG